MKIFEQMSNTAAYVSLKWCEMMDKLGYPVGMNSLWTYTHS